ncbi:protein-L-isoaspartate(D-aspartate) O-methyltransferase [Pseudoxanthomonas sp. UTMC 1351]|uniref:protein-L-isoaspartate(D-aspartate) O-methyltransferase n=1 Tax=Pseudoxanthomonas sp. UTMC 1351 TaxID=2695853 RepID=UPI0034CF61D9
MNFQAQRERMVDQQIVRRGVRNRHVLDAMRKIPREQFVADELREFAYEDSPLPIAAGQTISQPYIVALMMDAAEICPADRVMEIGAGSGYAAAVAGAVASRVYAIERHAELTALANGRLQRLGYTNVEVRTGDGTAGWAEAAPFDVILAAAGGPSVPEVLLKQLAPGGRLVMPVGDSRRKQHLIKVTRRGQDDYEQEDLGPVLFVPLIGEHGWAAQEGDAPAVVEKAYQERDGDAAVIQIRRAAEPLPALNGYAPDDDAFGRAFDRFSSAQVVLLGESTHGTSEFYRARAAITRRLVEAHGFNIVAVEADWPDAAAIDRYIRHRSSESDPEVVFQRFPTWMWRNTDVDDFVHWLRDHNATRDADHQVGFHGLDLYSLNRSIRAVIDYLDRVDPETAGIARERYSCLTPWARDPAGYGRMALNKGYAVCEEAVTDMLRELLERRLEFVGDQNDYLDAEQNARLVRSAEAYYRAMYYGSAESWNLRDTHMFEILRQLLAARGQDAKAVVWAHNSHIGDARHTEMGQLREELNLGQLCRQHLPGPVALIGFGTHTGTVAAASNWDSPMKVMEVRPSLEGSYERACHQAGIGRFLLDMREDEDRTELREALMGPRLERFIGVIYRPDTERFSHYAEAVLPQQFDAFVWFDTSRAVEALPGKSRPGVPETYPFGL